MEENQFWVAIWKIIGTVFVFSILTVAGCQGYKTHTVTQAVTTSQDPIKVACALNNVGSTTTAEAILCLKAVEK